MRGLVVALGLSHCSRWSSRRTRRWRAPQAPDHSAGAGARPHAADRSGGQDRPAAERPPLFHPPERAARQPRVDAAGGQRRRRSRKKPTSAAWRTSSSTWRSTAPSTSSRASWCRSSNRSARASARTSTPRRRSTKPSTCSTFRPTSPATSISGMLVLHDFAAGISLLPEEVEKERGVVLEEWRGRLGAGSRLTDKQLPVIFQGSRYAERLPIGLPEILKSAPRERLLAFYQKWYRPDQHGRRRGRRHPGRRGREAGAAALRRHSGGQGRRWRPSTRACRRTRTR